MNEVNIYSVPWDSRECDSRKCVSLPSPGSVREMLGLLPYEVVEVNPSQHPQYEVMSPIVAGM